MLDVLQIILWSCAYILIVLSGIKSKKIKKIGIPFAAGVPNLAWEICALCNSGGFWGHILWLVLDLFIFAINYKFIKKTRNKKIYLIVTLLITFFFFFIFKLDKGMLISVFIIDFTMAVFYVVFFKDISPYYKIPVAVLKLFGDLFAGIYNSYELIVAVITVLVFICNIAYLVLCIREYLILGKDEYYNVKIERDKVSSNCGKMNKKKTKKMMVVQKCDVLPKNPECDSVQDFYLLPITSSLFTKTHSGFFGK